MPTETNKPKNKGTTTPPTHKEDSLVIGKLDNIQWEMFCNYYVSDETLGNGVRSYMKAYPDADYNTAKSSAAALITNHNIITRINELLNEIGLSEQFADKTLLYVMAQHQDIPSKLRAVSEFNKMKGRYAPEKIETTVNIDTKRLEKLDELLKNAID